MMFMEKEFFIDKLKVLHGVHGVFLVKITRRAQRTFGEDYTEKVTQRALSVFNKEDTESTEKAKPIFIKHIF